MPFLLCIPGIDPGTRYELCSLVDLAPTILGVLTPWLEPAAVDRFRSQERGYDLLSPAFKPRGLLGMSTASKAVHDSRSEMSWTRGDWRLIVRQIEGRPEQVELYDLRKDHHERKNRAERHPNQVIKLRAELRDALRHQAARKGGQERKATEDELKKLRALGYGD